MFLPPSLPPSPSVDLLIVRMTSSMFLPSSPSVVDMSHNRLSDPEVQHVFFAMPKLVSLSSQTRLNCYTGVHCCFATERFEPNGQSGDTGDKKLSQKLHM